MASDESKVINEKNEKKTLTPKENIHERNHIEQVMQPGVEESPIRDPSDALR
jgi:hypothetical protein